MLPDGTVAQQPGGVRPGLAGELLASPPFCRHGHHLSRILGVEREPSMGLAVYLSSVGTSSPGLQRFSILVQGVVVPSCGWGALSGGTQETEVRQGGLSLGFTPPGG